MIRSILVALDDTPGAAAARDIAISAARRSGARLTAAAVLDLHQPSAPGPAPARGATFLERRHAVLARRAEEEAEAAFAAFAAAAGDLPYEALRLEDAAEPALLWAGARHDMIVLGRDSTLGQEVNEDGLAPVIEALLHRGARPLLVVPPPAEMPGSAPAGTVLVGYDASLPAMRALQLYALLKPEGRVRAKVLSCHEDRGRARRVAEEGADYLRRHGMEAEAIGVSGGDPAGLLLARAAAGPVRLLVMGASGATGPRVLPPGSATRRLLREMPCPIFVHH